MRHTLSDAPTRTSYRNIFLLAGSLIFFWAIFDGIMAFVAPIAISEHGISETALGFIIASSSLAGFFFDIFLLNFLPATNFRRLFALMFIIAATFPFLLWTGSSISIFILAMATWGMYYDLNRMAIYDLISRRSPEKRHAASFGLIQAFSALGYLTAPIMAGILISDTVAGNPYLAAYFFLAVAAVIFGVLLKRTNTADLRQKRAHKSVSILREIRLWRALSHKLMPVLIVTLFLNVYAAFFWTIGPLFANTLTTLGSLEGIFMTAFLLPTFISGWLVGRITFRRGKKRLAILAIAVGSLFLTTVGFFENDLIFVLVTFVSSFFVSLALPAINGAFADYISEARKISTEIVTLEDSFTNIGYIIGPIVAGVVSDFFGYTFAFSFLGFSGLVIAAILWRITPRSINVAPIAKRY